MNIVPLARGSSIGSRAASWRRSTATLAVLVFSWTLACRAETTSYSGATAITSLPCQLSTSGTYYLAADLSINADIAYAINITAPNVTLDFNGHTLSQLYTNDNGTIGVSVEASNVTVRNGTILGFLEGINLTGDNARLSDLLVVQSTYQGIYTNGTNALVQRCRVNNTGGSTKPGLAAYAMGIWVNGDNNRVIDNDVITVTPGPGCYTVCIWMVGGQNDLAVNNRVSSGVYGVDFSYSSGKYRDNLCSSDVSVPYGFYQSTAIDAGNNE